MTKDTEAIELLEDIKTASGKSQRDVFYYLKADQVIELLTKEQPPASEFTRRARLIATHCPSKPRTTMEETILEACGRLDTSKAAINELVLACERFNFIPDCGGDFCINDDGTWFAETTTQEKCSHIGYCKWAYDNKKRFEAALKKYKKG